MPEWIAGPEDSGCKLLAFIAQKMGGQYSARYLKRAIENSRCQVNGRAERFSTAVIGKGDHITILLDEPLPSSKPPEFSAQRVLFEDDDLLIYDKPPGINCDDKGILQILKDYNPSVQLVHRLDRDTSGVLLLAKNQPSFQNLLDQFKKATLSKCYRAIVDGIIQAKSGVIDNFLGKKIVYAGQTIWGAVKSGGLHAHTEWRKIKTGKQSTLLHCYPKTGRTHQIRVHMSESGHPILGDFQYAKHFNCPYRPERILLHAEQIIFLHPKSGRLMTIEASLPEDFTTAQNQLFGIVDILNN